MNIILFFGNNTNKGGININKIYLSNTSIQIFRTCKRRFKYKYIDRINAGVKISNKYLSFGCSVHAAMHHFNLMNDENQKTLETLQNLLRMNWVRDGYESIEEERQFGLKGLKLLETYFAYPLDIGRKNLILEDMLKKYVDERFILCGKIDKAYINDEDELEVLDYKTGDNIDGNIENDIQLPIYILLVKEVLGDYPKVVSYYYLSQNRKIIHFVTEEDITTTENFISSIIDEINTTKEFEAIPTEYCKTSCEFYAMCPEAQDSGKIIAQKLLTVQRQDTLTKLF